MHNQHLSRFSCAALLAAFFFALPPEGFALSLTGPGLDEPAPSQEVVKVPEADPLANNPALKNLIQPAPSTPPPAPADDEEDSADEAAPSTPSSYKLITASPGKKSSRPAKAATSRDAKGKTARSSKHVGASGAGATGQSPTAAKHKATEGAAGAAAAANNDKGNGKKHGGVATAAAADAKTAASEDDAKQGDAEADKTHKEFDKLMAKRAREANMSQEEIDRGSKNTGGVANHKSQNKSGGQKSGVSIADKAPGSAAHAPKTASSGGGSGAHVVGAMQAGKSGNGGKKFGPGGADDDKEEKEKQEQLKKEDMEEDEMNSFFNDTNQ